MPVVTQEQLEQKEQALKAVLAGGESLTPEKLREARKQLRRAQRKRRRLAAEAVRRAPKEQPKLEAKADVPTAEAPAAETPAADSGDTEKPAEE